MIDLQMPEKPTADQYWIQDQVAAFASTTPPLDFDMSDILEVDLQAHNVSLDAASFTLTAGRDQLYFDRVHPVASIIHHASQTDFQNSQPAQSDYLSAAINASGERSQPPFAEAIVATTICWRGLSLKRMAPVPVACSSDASHSILPCYESLFQTLKKRQALMLVPQSYAQPLEPMRLFAHMLNHAAVVWMYLIMDGWHGEVEQHMYDDRYASAKVDEAIRSLGGLPRATPRKSRLHDQSPEALAKDPSNANRLATKYTDVLEAEDMGGYCKTAPTLLAVRDEDLQLTDEMPILDWMG
ncbi:hypothetical protein NLG97_g6477 [Lecanicillium saksenae]|uniref:Uncharacterized protein n=1 Tax=Lecanicillium saksenae TaxID=468837 RepID=A0ACC1QPK1_9HYPO|nr:hypothetical protein NLG97_g6477 [Lecanicillium saksenae]